MSHARHGEDALCVQLVHGSEGDGLRVAHASPSPSHRCTSCCTHPRRDALDACAALVLAPYLRDESGSCVALALASVHQLLHASSP